jgi:acyl-CoA synthetase (AMP-forming)/AMP-acid ligase II
VPDAAGERVAGALLGAGAPDAPALLDGSRVVTYGDLAARVAARAVELDLGSRAVVVLRAENTLDFVTTYLAVLGDGHVPLLAGDHHAALATAWDAAAVVVDGEIRRRRVARPAELHPDLALLLSTSGSTGSPKLVRLSHRNVVSNARAIAELLALSAADRAITTLPLHYCYGLSVLHSHLVAGAGVVLTEASVVDPCFAVAMRDGAVTNVAGVAHTFELLERAGPDAIHVPSLRFLTQAGGRMAPDGLRAWRARAATWGVDLFVMYGQTEATARMACLPPSLAARHPDAIGRPIPGGQLTLRPVDGEGEGVGELVYRGPNVMLGYATEAADLALGATLDELPTGDLARHDPVDDVFEIVGRRSRFIKPFGLRIDLDAVEHTLGAAGLGGVATGDDERLVVGVPGASPERVAAVLAARTGLPPAAIVVDAGAVPRTANGKVDYATLSGRNAGHRVGAPTASVAEVYATVLGRGDVGPESTFVSLGGDSLSYVECSVRLERRLGRLPADWHLRRVGELDAVVPRPGLPRLDTTALLRTVGILLVVSTHMFLWYFPGGAHLMLSVVGYNASRFHFPIEGTRARTVAVLRSLGRIAVPVVVFTAVCMLLVGGYGLPTLALVNNYLGPVTHQEGRWHHWFIEAVVQILLVVTALLAIGPVRRLERRLPYLFPLLVLGAALVLREHWVVIGGYDNLRFQPHGVLWFVVLGWLVHRSTTVLQKVATTAICLLVLPDFFARAERGWFIAGGLILLLWCREIPMPRLAIRPIAAIAAASMAIFVSHFRIFPVLDRNLAREWAYVATIAAGVGIWFGGEVALRQARRAVTAFRARERTLAAPERVAVAID